MTKDRVQLDDITARPVETAKSVASHILQHSSSRHEAQAILGIARAMLDVFFPNGLPNPSGLIPNQIWETTMRNDDCPRKSPARAESLHSAETKRTNAAELNRRAFMMFTVCAMRPRAIARSLGMTDTEAMIAAIEGCEADAERRIRKAAEIASRDRFPVRRSA